ncbi:putative cyclin-dependent kinase F-2 [Panicum virgatum]|uniref:putative cyclin-dependent kinase F-2 n=1 Tax=Panicum virgatum TaxID=38727 RepID=UPI0019D53B3A|nr:putative cyclin-dependent kinase F-2 [Panicum virgatum]
MAVFQKSPSSRAEGGCLCLAAERRRCAAATTLFAGEDAPAPTDRRGSDDDGARLGSVESNQRLRKIGEGAFGAVSKVVAIKSSRDGGGAALLLREATLLAACRGNPGVVRLLEVVRGSGMNDDLHLVLEYVGPSLHDVIGTRHRRGIPFTESEARRAMGRRLKICDLGLARSAAAPPPDEQQVDGTVGYIAPEVLLREDCGAPVDMWALGCIMAELVMGQSLFPEEDLCQQLIAIIDLLGIPDDVSLMPLGIDARAPSKLREKVPEERLSAAGFDVLHGLLQYDPKDRLTAAVALQMPRFAVAPMDD